MGSKKRTSKDKNVRMLGHDRIEEFFQNGAGSKRQKHRDKLDHNTEALATSIYSRKTAKAYRATWNRYCDAMKMAGFKVNGHSPRTLEEAARFMSDYISELKQTRGYFGTEHLSESTIRLYFAGPAKVLGLKAEDYEFGKRSRANIRRSRGNRQAADFSPAKHQDLIIFERCTGLRNYKELQAITGEDLIQDPDTGDSFIRVQGKGGRVRNAPIVGTPEEVKFVVDKMHEAGAGLVWPKGTVPKHYDAHADRAYYACKVYLQYARPVETLPRNERYDCRKDLKGEHYDRAAMRQASLALGHSRISVIAENYLWRLKEVQNEIYAKKQNSVNESPN
jgi:hypothetical protein